MITDRELLRRFVHENSEEAFAEIVRRHVDLVYGSARRQLCGNETLAEDVTQMVFTTLAAQARTAREIQHLTAWLHATTRFTVSHTVRGERRRQEREQQLHTMNALTSGSDDFPAIPPELLDSVLDQLDEVDREAVFLRFLEGRSFPSLATALEIKEDAARMRVNRALEKMRELFAQQGITSSSAAVSALLAQQVSAAPANLAATVSAVALGGTATLVGTKAGVATLMTTSKSLWIAGAAVLAAIGYSVHLHGEADRQNDEIARLTSEQQRLQTELKRSEDRAIKNGQRAANAELRLAERAATASPAPIVNRAPTASVDSDADKIARRDRKLAELRPLLEAGQPITGAIVVYVNGKPADKPVSFVIGKDTKIECDDGIYVLTPILNRDNSILFKVGLEMKDADGNAKRSNFNMAVISTPWTGFSLATKDGKILAFDPDMNPP